MLQLTNCCLEWVKTWTSCNIYWEGIPLDNSKRKERILIGIFASVNLTECQGMAISGDPMSGLDVIGKGYGHEAIYYFIKEKETDHWASLFKCLPVQMVQQWSDASRSGIIVRGPPGCASLNHFNLMGILFSVCVWGGGQIVEAYFWYLWCRSPIFGFAFIYFKRICFI